jgi:hypothetical protein
MGDFRNVFIAKFSQQFVQNKSITGERIFFGSLTRGNLNKI